MVRVAGDQFVGQPLDGVGIIWQVTFGAVELNVVGKAEHCIELIRYFSC